MVHEHFFREMLTDDIQEADVIVSGFAYEEGCSCGSGTSKAPEKILDLSGFLPCSSKDGEKIDKLKIFNNGILKSTKNYLEVAYDKASEAYISNKFNLFLGGDHSISIATEKAFYEYAKQIGKKPVIIHLDAHPDYCRVYDGSKYSHACPNARAIDNGFNYEDISLLGIRGFELQEIDLFNAHPEIPLYTAKMIKEHGVKKIMKNVIKQYKDCLVHVSFDIDITDPAYAPGTGTPEAFGLTNDEVLEILLTIFNNLNVQSMDLVEVSPSLDVNDITSWLALKNLYEIFNILNRRK